MSSPFTDRMGRPLSWSEAVQKIAVRFYNYWLELVTGFLWYIVGAMPSHVVRRFFYRMSGVQIGKGSTIHMFARFYDPTHVRIGEGTLIGDQVVLDGRASLTIGNHVDVGTGVMFFNAEHDLRTDDFRPIEEPIEVGDYVFIGPRAIILPGVKIGKGAVVAAGAVVTKDVLAMSIVGGVPAKEIGKRSGELKYRLGRPRLFQ
ncbi:MAG TPA: acyltransferase [Candidatus Pacebacteria bacterium]|nr:MAG: Acetyltransferase [Microgenomates group bacterium GW2011_GWB1_45_17]KKU22817.1 MAG: Acetyltransferase [Microgenomates group bacterium GW2011_GWA1_46_15]KKU23424.1 MAG: Acetyltransferase [Microgenomates group bacterium GW2011_GWC1_46_15]HAV14968.1 acyltransferase [Candidatus Paceibacterota bacterium]HCR11615.1 acyltransferase [Candidatus Paceibacterota bacterium]